MGTRGGKYGPAARDVEAQANGARAHNPEDPAHERAQPEQHGAHQRGDAHGDRDLVALDGPYRERDQQHRYTQCRG
jgi:hypothetical protein